jgi:glycogen debranching enzyme
MYKLVDSINFSSEIKEVINSKGKVIINRDNSREVYKLNECLTCDVENYFDEVSIDLDFRFLYDFPIFGRVYELKKQDNIIIVKYTKFDNKFNDNIEEIFFLAIKVDNLDDSSLALIDNWIQKNYSIDEKRDYPSSRYVNNAIKFKIKNGSGRMTFSFDHDLNKVLDKLNHFHSYPIIPNASNKKESRFSFELDALDYSLNLNIHNILINNRYYVKQIFAGWAWFFQFWTRDSLISLGALILNKKYGLVQKILDEYLSLEDNRGLIDSRIPSSQLKAIDSTGWLFKRYYDFIYSLTKKSDLHNFYNYNSLTKLNNRLRKVFDDFTRNNIKDGLVYSGKNETWMDTDYADTGREGFCIEIQALTLTMIKTLRLLSILTKTRLLKRHADIETKLLINVRKKFFNNGRIADLVNNNPVSVQRSNLFLAYYIYPHMFRKEEWKTAFTHALKKLWLEWGGLSSIDKTHNSFTPEHTGSNNKSYHRGDSWYFMNNIAAISLYAVDSIGFSNYVNKIFDASRKDLFFSGVIGGASEISSASHQTGEGCLNQSWSSATFIELISALYLGKDNFIMN